MKDKSLWSSVHAWGLHPSPGCLGHMTDASLNATFLTLFLWRFLSVPSQKPSLYYEMEYFFMKLPEEKYV